MSSLNGMFANRTQHAGRSFKVHRAKRDRSKLDAFADLLAEEVKPETAAIMLGYTGAYGRVLLGKLRKRLGWQAQ